MRARREGLDPVGRRPNEKEDEGSAASRADGVVQRALRELRGRVSRIAALTDVCLCEYTAHGHCGEILRTDLNNSVEVDNDATLDVLAHTAVSGALMREPTSCAPSDMMDGRVAAIRAELPETPIVGVLGDVRVRVLRTVP